MFDINEVPYAEWLEKSLQAIVPLKPVSLCFAAAMPDGEVYTGYYNADATDKAVIAHNIQADITRHHNGHYSDQCRDHQRHDRALRRG